MKNILNDKKYCILILVLATLGFFFSCKKSEIDKDEIKLENPLVAESAKKDSGFVVIYTSDPVYTDPSNGAVTSANIDVSINNISRGKIYFFGTAVNNKVPYGTKGTLSLKLPTGDVAVKSTTIAGVTRSINTLIAKNDTIKVRVDYSFKDPNNNSYYLEYYDNGILKKFTSLTRWQFFVNPQQRTFGSLPGCVVKNGSYDFDGPSYISPLYGNPPSDVVIKLLRSWKLKPSLGSYSYASGNLDFSAQGERVACNIGDSFASLNVLEVKIMKIWDWKKEGTTQVLLTL